MYAPQPGITVYPSVAFVLLMSPVSEKGRGSNNRVPIFPTATMSANVFSTHGCHGAICSIL